MATQIGKSTYSLITFSPGKLDLTLLQEEVSQAFLLVENDFHDATRRDFVLTYLRHVWTSDPDTNENKKAETILQGFLKKYESVVIKNKGYPKGTAVEIGTTRTMRRPVENVHVKGWLYTSSICAICSSIGNHGDVEYEDGIIRRMCGDCFDEKYRK